MTDLIQQAREKNHSAMQSVLVAPSKIVAASEKFEGNTGISAELVQSVRDAMEDWAAWYASGNTPLEDIETRLTALHDQCRIKILTPEDIKQIARNGYTNYIDTYAQWVEHKDPMLTKNSDWDTLIYDTEIAIANSTTPFRWGVHQLDDALGGGVRRGQILSLVGLPGAMKTSLFLNGIETCLAETSYRITFFSLDMRPTDLMQRMILREMACGFRQMREEAIAKTERYLCAVAKVKERYLDRFVLLPGKRKRLTVRDLEEHVRYAQPDVVLVDYVTLLKDNADESDYHIANRVVDSAVQLTTDYDCIIVLASQMSLASRLEKARGGYGSARGGPIIQERSDFELSLEKPEYNPEEDPHVRAKIEKTREQSSGRYFNLYYNPAGLYFYDTAQEVVPVKRKKNAFADFIAV